MSINILEINLYWFVLDELQSNGLVWYIYALSTQKLFCTNIAWRADVINQITSYWGCKKKVSVAYELLKKVT